MKEPLVTIVTITFNLVKAGRVNYFEQNVKSVHGQTYKNIEHLIIDGASNDGTLETIKKYAKKGWLNYTSEPDKGVYDAMNKGLKAAKGKYIAFLNSDDFYHNKSAVELSVKKLEKENKDFSYANYIVIGKNQRYIEKGELERFIYIMPFGHPTMFAKTEVLRKIGGFDEKMGLPADYDLIIRLILKGYSSTYIDSEIATYRLGGLGVINDHSNDIGRLYVKNYSAFHKFKDAKEAKKIMYENILPKDFSRNFLTFAKKNKLQNIDLNKVKSKLDALSPQKKNDVLVEIIKNYLRGSSVIMKIWKAIK